MQAIYKQKGDSIDYTPATDVAAGDVVALQEAGTDNYFAAIAKLDIKAGELGAVAVEGVFRFTSFRSDVQLWSPVAWDVGEQEVVLGNTAGIDVTPLGIVIGVYDDAIDVKLVRGLTYSST